MVWETRQERLRRLVAEGNKAFGAPRDLLEPSQQMCFQVVTIYFPQTVIDEKKFDQIKNRYSFTDEEIDMVALFSVDYGPLEIPAGFIAFDDFGNKEVYEPIFETIYTSTNKALVRDILKTDSEDESDHLREISQQYIPMLEHKFSNIRFTKGIFGYSNDFNLFFQIVAQPYKPSLCPPEELDVLKPITIIDGHVINPETDRLDLSSIQLQTPTRQP